jgi:hypothetical protein
MVSRACSFGSWVQFPPEVSGFYCPSNFDLQWRINPLGVLVDLRLAST